MYSQKRAIVLLKSMRRPEIFEAVWGVCSRVCICSVSTRLHLHHASMWVELSQWKEASLFMSCPWGRAPREAGKTLTLIFFFFLQITPGTAHGKFSEVKQIHTHMNYQYFAQKSIIRLKKKTCIDILNPPLFPLVHLLICQWCYYIYICIINMVFCV